MCIPPNPCVNSGSILSSVLRLETGTLTLGLCGVGIKLYQLRYLRSFYFIYTSSWIIIYLIVCNQQRWFKYHLNQVHLNSTLKSWRIVNVLKVMREVRDRSGMEYVTYLHESGINSWWTESQSIIQIKPHTCSPKEKVHPLVADEMGCELQPAFDPIEA